MFLAVSDVIGEMRGWSGGSDCMGRKRAMGGDHGMSGVMVPDRGPMPLDGHYSGQQIGMGAMRNAGMIKSRRMMVWFRV